MIELLCGDFGFSQIGFTQVAFWGHLMLFFSMFLY